MNTATIQIGNSDDRLPQLDWSRFVAETARKIGDICVRVHFHACSEGGAGWQNACWVIEIDPERMEEIREYLSPIGKQFQQDSIAITFGTTEFI